MRRNTFANQPKVVWRRLAEDEGLVEDYGTRDFDAKLTRFVEIPPPWARMIWPNLQSENEVYDAYVFGAFYPALTGACCLAEAVLNILVTRLRGHFKHTPGYKRVYNKDSFQNWIPVIDILAEWGILDEKGPERLKRLYSMRLEAIHLRTLEDVHRKAREALEIYSETVSRLFGPRADLIFWCPGEMYIKREKESDPLVKEFFLSSCWYVGYKHSLTGDLLTGLKVVDADDYDDRIVEDSEFRRLREEERKKS